MSKWLILLQTQSEKPANITRWLNELNQDFITINLWEEKIPTDIDGYSGLIIMGGTMSANDSAEFPFISNEIDLIQQWLKTEKPMLGICLGAQLMAKALGEKVWKGKKPEIGWVKIHFSGHGASDMMFSEFAPEATVFEWHFDTFELPRDTDRLASSELYQNQAFRFGQNAYGLQFHPEVDEALIYRWVEMHREKLMKLNPDLENKIMVGIPDHLERFEKLGRHIVKTLCHKADCHI